ncbi:response regulator transcription factor [Ideonella sp. 4Y11]|uniref:Response regulator transcription factor n=1 Tax=Ideonella aquatica TaxID=2824119 RepID=A0A941BIB9_9BURK|nr:LytTR family DNA-binding domain-containing protein [Ideonella aquatica]MBQ0957688.1 response regulator transcription factor [Ideonella aquatica]
MPDTVLTVLIVDDEPLARMRLRGLLADATQPRLQVLAEAGSAAEALHALARQPVDLVLLDIHMPGLDGLGLAERLREQQPAPAVVFVTAHAEHALRAFELEAVDYLTKPVRRERLAQAVQRVAARRGQRPVPTAPVDERPMLVVSDRGRVLRIPLSELVYLRAEMKYVTLRTRSHSYVLDDSLGELEQRLGEAVIRIHRSVLVARQAVRALARHPLDTGEDTGEGWAVQVEPTGEWLPVSRRQLSAVRDALAGGAA